MAISGIPLMLHRADVVTNEDKDAFVEAAEITFDHLSNTTVGEMNTLGTNVSKSEANIIAKKIDVDASEQSVAENTAIVIQKASEVLDYAIPEEATYNSTAIDTKNNKQNKANLSGYGIVLNNNINEIRPQDIFVEVDVPNVARLSEEAKQGQVRFTDGLHDINPADFMLPVAPFASEGTDELLDDKVNGLTCQTAHSKGDIVVTGNELVTNGDGASTTGWTLTSVVDTSGGEFDITTTTTGGMYRSIPTVAGMTYIVTGKFISETVDTVLRVNPNNNASGTGATDIQPVDSRFFTEIEATGPFIMVYVRLSAAGNAVVDNISVKLKDQSYIATRDTADMYDYEAEAGVEYSVVDGDVFKIVGSFNYAEVGQYIKYTGANATFTSSYATSLNVNSGPWQYLGTADSMSLQNPYFKTIPNVTKQVALLVEKTSTGVIQNTVKTLVNMRGEESVETFEADIFTELGCTQVADRVWTDGSSEFFLLTLKGYLNAGGTQTFFNTHGRSIKGTNDGLTEGATSLYDSFVGQTSGIIGGTSGCSDGKFYDKAYLEGQGGLICFAAPNAKTPTYKHMEEIKRNLNDGYIENGVELVSIGSSTTIHYVSPTVSAFKINIVQPSNMSNSESSYGILQMSRNGVVEKISCTYYRSLIDNTLVISYIGADMYADTDTIEFFAVTSKSPYLATQGSHTHTDLIGSPDNYPAELTNLLSSGGSVGFMNALLVDDGDNSNVPDGIKTTFKMSKSVVEQLQVLKSTDSGVTWTTETVTFDSVANTITFTTAPATSDLIIVSNITLNQSAIPISTPKAIEHPDRDLIASNSHSEYAYNGLVYAGTGKVATGGSVESKSVENIIQDENKSIITTPTHNVITLDGDSIIGVKALVAQTESATQIFTQELLYDVDWGDTDEFDSLTEATTTNLNGDDVQHKILYKPSSVRI